MFKTGHIKAVLMKPELRLGMMKGACKIMPPESVEIRHVKCQDIHLDSAILTTFKHPVAPPISISSICAFVHYANAR